MSRALDQTDRQQRPRVGEEGPQVQAAGTRVGRDGWRPHREHGRPSAAEAPGVLAHELSGPPPRKNPGAVGATACRLRRASANGFSSSAGPARPPPTVAPPAIEDARGYGPR